MDGSHPVKLFRHGDKQAVDIPAEFELPGEDAVMHRDGKRLIIEPAPSKGSIGGLLNVLAGMGPIEERLEPFEDAPPRPVNF